MKLGGGEPLCLQLFGFLFFCLYWISLCVAPYRSIWLERRGLLKNSLFGSMFGRKGKWRGYHPSPHYLLPFIIWGFGWTEKYLNRLELTIKRAAKTVYQVVTLGIFIVTSLDKLAKSIILIAFKVPLWMHQVLVKKNNLTHSLPPPLALLLFVIDLKDQVFNEVI